MGRWSCCLLFLLTWSPPAERPAAPESESDSVVLSPSAPPGSGMDPPSLSESDGYSSRDGGSRPSARASTCAWDASCGMNGIDTVEVPAEPGMQTLVASIRGDDGVVPLSSVPCVWTPRSVSTPIEGGGRWDPPDKVNMWSRKTGGGWSPLGEGSLPTTAELAVLSFFASRLCAAVLMFCSSLGRSPPRSDRPRPDRPPSARGSVVRGAPPAEV